MSEYKSMKTNFENHLLKEGYTPSTVRSYTYILDQFILFLHKENTLPQEARQADVLTFLQQQTASKETKAHYLFSIKYFFRFLKAENLTERNPVERLRIRGLKRNTLYTVLEPHELHELYAACTKDVRKKALLGFLIYQGIQALELPKLNIKHLDLREGTIFIPEGVKNAERTLPLHSAQILDLHEYVAHTRPELLRKMNKKETDQLLLGRDKLQISNTTVTVLNELRKKYPHIKPLSTKQIRTSVIVRHLKTHNLRQVQYFAGHRNISTTEKYLQNDTQSLSKEIETFHPLDRF